MTREEAITVLNGFLENPLCSDKHIQAFNIAIHDIKQHHDWNINKLMLVPKTEYRLTNSEWVEFLSIQFDVSRTSAKEMLHVMMSVKRNDNFNKQFSGRK